MARQELLADGVFVNNLHEPYARIREDSTQMRSNTNLALGGSDPLMCPNPDRVFGGSDLGASMAMSSGDITVMALDPAD